MTFGTFSSSSFFYFFINITLMSFISESVSKSDTSLSWAQGFLRTADNWKLLTCFSFLFTPYIRDVKIRRDFSTFYASCEVEPTLGVALSLYLISFSAEENCLPRKFFSSISLPYFHPSTISQSRTISSGAPLRDL